MKFFFFKWWERPPKATKDDSADPVTEWLATEAIVRPEEMKAEAPPKPESNRAAAEKAIGAFQAASFENPEQREDAFVHSVAARGFKRKKSG